MRVKILWLNGLVFISDVSISTSNIHRSITCLSLATFVLTNGSNDQHVTAPAYAACTYACVANENQESLYFLFVS